MSESSDAKQLVSLVADGLLRREPESSVSEKLVAVGVPRSEAPALYRAIRAACQRGVQSVVTGGVSAPDGPPSDPLLAEAFRVGQASIRRATGTPWHRSLVVSVVLVGAVAAVLWLFSR